MRRFFLLAIFSLLACFGAEAITFVQAAQNEATSATAVTVTVTTTANNGLIILVSQGANGTATVAITDSASQTWTQTASGYETPTQGRVAMFFKANSASVTSVTATWSPSISDRIDIILFEFSGLATSSLEDSSVNNSQGSGTTATSGALTTTNAVDVLVFGVNMAGAFTSPTAGAGYTIPTNGSSARCAMQYKIVAATQSAGTTTLTWTTAQTNGNIYGGFKGTSAAALPGFDKARRLEMIDTSRRK